MGDGHVLAGGGQHALRGLDGAGQAAHQHAVEAHARGGEQRAGRVGLGAAGLVERHRVRRHRGAVGGEVVDRAMAHQV